MDEDFRTMSLKKLEEFLNEKITRWYKMREENCREDLSALLNIMGEIIMVQNEVITRLLLSK